MDDSCALTIWPSLVPRHSKNGESAWYTLFAHALNYMYLRNSYMYVMITNDTTYHKGWVSVMYVRICSYTYKCTLVTETESTRISH